MIITVFRADFKHLLRAVHTHRPFMTKKALFSTKTTKNTPKCANFGKMRGKNSQLYPFIELSYPFLVILSPGNPTDKSNDEKQRNNKINNATNVCGNKNNNNRNYKKIDNNRNDNIGSSNDNNNDNSNL